MKNKKNIVTIIKQNFVTNSEREKRSQTLIKNLNKFKQN